MEERVALILEANALISYANSIYDKQTKAKILEEAYNLLKKAKELRLDHITR